MKLVFGGIARNIAKTYSALYDFVDAIVTHSPDSRVVIYENNSDDDTPQLLAFLGIRNPNIHIVSETVSDDELIARGKTMTWDRKPCRIEAIAYARNRLLDIMRDDICDEDRVVFFDCDMIKSPDVPALIKKAHEMPADVDGLFANGVAHDGRTYYDLYALRAAGFNGPEFVGDQFWKTLPRLQITQMMPVYSAFGGLAIYRGICLRDNYYSAHPTSSFDSFYRRVLQRPPTAPTTHHEGCLLGMYLFGTDGLFYYNNSGYSYPIVCEHVTFNAAAAERGCGRFFIDPDLVFYSSH